MIMPGDNELAGEHQLAQFLQARLDAVVRGAVVPLGIEASLAAAERLEVDRDGALAQWRLGVERANYEAQRAERRYRVVDPDNRLVARGLERDWEERLRALETAKIELERREKERPRVISQAERDRLSAPPFQRS